MLVSVLHLNSSEFLNMGYSAKIFMVYLERSTFARTLMNFASENKHKNLIYKGHVWNERLRTPA